MKEFVEQLFDQQKGTIGSVSDVRFNRCTFRHCRLRGQEDPAKRLFVQRVHVRDCRVTDCGIQRVIIEDTCIENLHVDDGELLMAWGCLFKHVVLRGRFGNININRPYTSAPRLDERLQQRFAEAAERYYGNVDWAIDIRDVHVAGLKIRGIPVSLIRRDPVTQAIVPLGQILEKRWESVDLGSSWWKAILNAEARTPSGDLVLVAPKLDTSFEAQLEGIRRLRLAGIAVSD